MSRMKLQRGSALIRGRAVVTRLAAPGASARVFPGELAHCYPGAPETLSRASTGSTDDPPPIVVTPAPAVLAARVN